MTGTCVIEWEMDIDLKTTTAYHTCMSPIITPRVKQY